MAESGGKAGEIPGEASASGQDSGDAEDFDEFFLRDLPEADVALALGVSAGTVKTHLHRALATLRASIGADFEEGYVHELQA
ncbi:MAG: sigma factor-like helix-turn-helix DNA-binding protein [Acidimicrobiales bacterium]|jgi:DNA-directed RNA polymerase specialized sigma24 family protein